MLRSTAMGGSERTVRRRLASGRESPVATRVGIAGRDQGTRTRENGALPATSVEAMGLEPTTSTLQRSHSSQLSYAPVSHGMCSTSDFTVPVGPGKT